MDMLHSNNYFFTLSQVVNSFFFFLRKRGGYAYELFDNKTEKTKTEISLREEHIQKGIAGSFNFILNEAIGNTNLRRE